MNKKPMTKKQVEALAEKAYEHGCKVSKEQGSLMNHAAFRFLAVSTQKGWIAAVRYVLRHK
jgi:hypothetical protein